MRGPEVLGQAGACRRQASYWMWLTGVLFKLCLAYLSLTELYYVGRDGRPQATQTAFSATRTRSSSTSPRAPLSLSLERDGPYKPQQAPDGAS